MKKRIMLCVFIAVNFCNIHLFAYENTIVHSLLSNLTVRV